MVASIIAINILLLLNFILRVFATKPLASNTLFQQPNLFGLTQCSNYHLYIFVKAFNHTSDQKLVFDTFLATKGLW